MGYKEQVLELESEIAAMKQRTYCAYCGKGYDIDTDAALVSEHIATCPKHPMRIVENRAETAELERDRFRKALEHIVNDLESPRLLSFDGWHAETYSTAIEVLGLEPKSERIGPK